MRKVAERVGIYKNRRRNWANFQNETLVKMAAVNNFHVCVWEATDQTQTVTPVLKIRM